MQPKKLKDGTLLIPLRAETSGVVGDCTVEIRTDHPEYEKWLKKVEAELAR